MIRRVCFGNKEKVEERFCFPKAIFHEETLNKSVNMILTLFLHDHDLSKLFNDRLVYGIEIRRNFLHVDIKELNQFFIEFVVEKSMCGFQNLTKNFLIWLNSLNIFEFLTKLFEEDASPADFHQLAWLVSPLIQYNS